MKMNESEIKKAEVLAVGEAYMTIFYPSAGSKSKKTL